VRKHPDSQPITAETFERLCAAVESRHPGKWWRALEVCPVAVVKTIDNEEDAKATIEMIRLAERSG